MKLLTFFTAFLLVELACTAPTSNDNEEKKFLFNEEYFPESLAIYTAKHDIVTILVPLNALNFKKVADNKEKSDPDTIAFIIEADISENGERVDKGLYLLKGGHTTKLLDNARDAVATNDNTKTAFFATKDGIYFYNEQKMKAEKYGSMADSLINVAKVNGSDVLYVLTDDHILYKVTEKGNKKEKIDTVVNAKQIVLDKQNVLYYCTTDNQVYVLRSNGVRKIEGLPQKPIHMNILRPPFIYEAGVPVVVNGKSYFVYENGTSERIALAFTEKPTAYSVETTFIQYYAYNKKLYELDITTLTFSNKMTQFKNYLGKNSLVTQFINTYGV